MRPRFVLLGIFSLLLVSVLSLFFLEVDLSYTFSYSSSPPSPSTSFSPTRSSLALSPQNSLSISPSSSPLLSSSSSSSPSPRSSFPSFLGLAYLILAHNEVTVRSGCKLFRAIFHSSPPSLSPPSSSSVSPSSYLFVLDTMTPPMWECHLRKCVAEVVKNSQEEEDKKKEEEKAKEKEEEETMRRAIVLKSGTVAGWGKVGLLQNEIDGMQILLNTFSDWSHLVILSGDSYPLVSQSNLLSRLSQEPLLNYLSSSGNGIKKRPELLYRLSDVVLPSGFELVFGTQWCTLTRDYVKWVFESETARDLLASFKNGKVRIADEMYFQTLIWNHPEFKYTLKGKDSQIQRYEIWYTQNCSVISKGHPYPCVLTEAEFPQMMGQNYTFARKLDFNLSKALYNLIDEQLLPSPGPSSPSPSFAVPFEFDDQFVEKCEREVKQTK